MMPVTGLEPYDDQNIFARILRGEIPNKTVYEDAHVLVIPKGRYVSAMDFAARASESEIAGFWRGVGTVAQMLGLEAEGYRLLANHGVNAGQEVPHFHVHVFGGGPLGRMIQAK